MTNSTRLRFMIHPHFPFFLLFVLTLMFALPSEAQQKRVRILVTDWCPYCSRLEAFLIKEKIRYEKLDVEQSSEGKKLYTQLGRGGVPIVLIGSAVVRGFDKAAILRELGQGDSQRGVSSGPLFSS